MQLGIVVTRASAIDTTWTTLHLARAALLRGHHVHFIEVRDLQLDDRHKMAARCTSFTPGPLSPPQIERMLQRPNAPRHYLRLASLDLVLMRCAPFDASVGALASLIQAQGIPVVNDPVAMMRVHHKGWLASLPDVPTPTTLLTTSLAEVQLFYEKIRKPVVIKPARGSGGNGVQFVRRHDPEGLFAAFRLAQADGHHVIVQAYLPEADAGEKRVIWLDGRVLGGYLRTRAPGDFRHNLKQGATAMPTHITPEEHASIAALTPHLLRTGLRFAGIDMIGTHIIEVNAVNPGGSYHTDRLHGTDVTGQIVVSLLAEIPTSPNGPS